MRKTTNYKFNMPEGSDTFNPLTATVPNFEKIDAAIYDVQNTAIPAAMETMDTLTKHSYTRDIPDAAMFRFTAAADNKPNDTYWVDGVQCQAKYANGELLRGNDWVSGAVIVAALVGMDLTFYVSAPASSDAATLGGYPASHFATQTDMDTANETIASHAKSIANNTELVNQALAQGGYNPELFWTSRISVPYQGFDQVNRSNVIPVPDGYKSVNLVLYSALSGGTGIKNDYRIITTTVTIDTDNLAVDNTSTADAPVRYRATVFASKSNSRTDGGWYLFGLSIFWDPVTREITTGSTGASEIDILNNKHKAYNTFQLCPVRAFGIK